MAEAEIRGACSKIKNHRTMHTCFLNFQRSWIYLGTSYSMETAAWTSMLKQSKGAIAFGKNVFRHFYTDKQACQRSVSGDPRLLSPGGIHVRVKVTPWKAAIIDSNYVSSCILFLGPA